MKRTTFSNKLLKEIYLSKTCFLFIDEERVSMASPVATGIINAYDIDFWDKVIDHEVSLEEILDALVTHLEGLGHKCKLVEIQGISVLTFFERESN
mgnify:CR=1 FL=1